MPRWPTASQKLGPTHETLASMAGTPGAPRLGVDCLVHAVPFHSSTTALFVSPPTASHPVAVQQDTPWRKTGAEGLDGFELGWIAQLLPSQPSNIACP